MTNLTKEYFDKKLDKLATKDGLKALEGNLKSHIKQEIAELAEITAKGFAHVDKRFDEVEKTFHNAGTTTSGSGAAGAELGCVTVSAAG